MTVYIECHPQKDCYVVSQLFRVAKQAGRLKLISKPAQLYVRLGFRPLDQQAFHVSLGNYKVLSNNISGSYYAHFWANTLGKGMNPLILPAMG